MTDVAIRCEGLAKRYRTGERESYKALRDVITEAFASPLRRLHSALRHSSNSSAHNEKPNIWALKDVSFEIKRGEAVGIIGRNGAGKSTLLKILSRITEPTEGHADIWGRVGSLLEVGTGFHPELTGRENIFLNGAILGMKKVEIARKFDEIVSFAEVDKFIDTPVKRYSSGMYVRLAFAVAAHMETEILLVDEVLAVGDVQFQKKCLGKMRDIGTHGRTVIFVSHNVNAVSSLCRSAMVFENGKLAQFSNNVQEVLNLYLSSGSRAHTADLCSHPGRAFSKAIFQRISVNEESKKASQGILPGRNVVVHLRVSPEVRITTPKVTIGVTNTRGERVFALGTHIGGTEIPSIEGPATIRVRFRIPALVPGQYSLDVGFYDRTGMPLDEVYAAAWIEVLKDNYINMVESHTHHVGNIMVRSQWTCTSDADAKAIDEFPPVAGVGSLPLNN